MADCWAYPVHPYQFSGRGGGSKAAVTSPYPKDGTLPANEFRQVKRVTLLVDSRDRDYTKYPSPSQYVVNLSESLHNVSNGVLISAELPATYYVFSEVMRNTSLTVSINNVVKTVTIPDGNYGFGTMATELEAVLSAAFPANTFGVVFKSATGKCSITALPTPSQFSVDCTAASKPTGWGLGYYLGFPRGVVTSAVGNIVTALAMANMNPEMYMLIDIDELNAVNQAAMYAGGPQSKVFAKVPMCQPTFQYTFYDKTLTCNEVRPPRSKIDKLTVSIRFHDGTPVDFHGAEHSLTLELTCTLTR